MKRSRAMAVDNRARDSHRFGRVVRGERFALRELYEDLGPRAMAVAVRVLKDQHAAEEVVQETFLELWKRSAQFDAKRGDASAWVVAIARSRSIDRLRSDGSASRAVDAASVIFEQPLVPVPDEILDERKNSVRVRLALRKLPRKERTAISLAYFGGLTQNEIARKTHEPLGTVKMRVRLGLVKLSGLLMAGHSPVGS